MSGPPDRPSSPAAAGPASPEEVRGVAALLRPFARGADAPPLEDQAEIDRRYARGRAVMLVGLTTTYAFYYVCRLGLSVMKQPIIDEGVFTALELGVIGMWFQYAYGFGKLLNGFLADRANVRRFVPLGLLLSAAVNAAMGSTSTVALATALWAVNGIFQGVGAPASVVGLTQWFSGRERGTVYGIWSAAHAIGEGITFVLTAGLVAHAGWRAGFYSASAVCVAAAIVAAFVLLDRPQTRGLPSPNAWKGHAEPAKTDEPASMWRTQLYVLKMPAIWVCGLASALMYVTRYAINSWGMLYLQKAHGYTLVESGWLVGVNTVAAIAGSIAYGFISDRFFDSRRPPVTLIFGVVEVASLFLIFYGDSTLARTVGFVVYGFTLSGLLAVLGGLMAVDVAPKKAAGVAMGFVGVFSYIGAGVQELISGWLIHEGTTVVDGVQQYDFGVAVYFWIGSSIASLLLAASLWRVRQTD